MSSEERPLMAAPNLHRQQQVKVLERCTVSPPLGSVPPSALRFTFFDVLTSTLQPVERLFFYHLPVSTSAFLSTHLPNLKHSLSLVLQLFFPLAGKVVSAGGGGAPELCYSDGDSVEFSVAECDDDDFYELASNRPKDVRRLYPLVPPLQQTAAEAGIGRPVFSLQVTVFPHSGVVIGVSIDHVAADGSSAIHFLKTWASIARLGYDEAISSAVLPSYDRTLVIAAVSSFFRQSTSDSGRGDPPPKVPDLRGLSPAAEVMATSVLTRAELDRLSEWVFSRTSTRCSEFAVACGVAWVSVVKAKASASTSSVSRSTTTSTTTDDAEEGLFCFVANCRNRLEPPVPPEYFGNCLGYCVAKKPRSDLVGSDGLAAAATAVREAVVELGREGVFRCINRSKSALTQGLDFGKLLTVAGSPRFEVYKVDFGWGRPRKVEVVSIDRTRAMSLAENGDEEEGGVEVGITLPADVMAEFRANFDSIKGIVACGCSGLELIKVV